MSALLPLEEAQNRLIALGTRLPIETISMQDALGRYLANDLAAKRSQPAADMSAMDGYAIDFRDREGPWKLVGECKAGNPPCDTLNSGETARIFTGAVLPKGADTVVMQENIEGDGETIHLSGQSPSKRGLHVRHRGGDFKTGETVLGVGILLKPAALGQAVSAGYGALTVGKRPSVAILSTGDELVKPGGETAAHQIPASNDVMVASMLSGLTAETLNINRIEDKLDSLCSALENAKNCDIIVTIGGASVGDHDLVAPAFEKLGGKTDFWKIAMKPGKPLMVGTLGNAVVVALPGNPVSAFVTATLFLLPLVRYLSGAANYMPQFQSAITTTVLPATDRRAQFIRARTKGGDITIFDSQDSAKLSILSAASALLYRPANAPEATQGTKVPFIAI